MSESGSGASPAIPGPITLEEDKDVGEEAVHFARWFMQSKYQFMGAFLGGIQRPTSAEARIAIHDRFCETLHHAQRVHHARTVVTILLALGAFTAASSAVANALGVVDVLARVAAFAGSITLLLLLARLAFDRYLERCDVAATFLAIQLASSRKQPQ